MTLLSVLGTIAVVTVSLPFARRHRPCPVRLHELIVEMVTSVGIAAVDPQPRRSRCTRRARCRRWAFVVLGLGALALVGGPLAVAVAITVGLLRPRIAATRRRRRHVAAVAAMYPDFVDLLVLTIRAGCTPVQAFHSLATMAEQPFQAVLIDIDRRVTAGARFAEAIGQLPLGLGAIAQPLTDGLALADRHGTPLMPMLDRLAEDARAQRRRNADAAARQLPIRLSFPLVGCTLPSFVLLTIVPLMAGTLSSFRGLRP